MAHNTFDLNLLSTLPDSWHWPSKEQLHELLSTAVLLDSEILQRTLGFYQPPKRVRTLHLTAAAHDQIHCMWWGHRQEGAQSPPPIPLRYFVSGFGQDGKGDQWVDIEILPGLETWDVGDT